MLFLDNKKVKLQKILSGIAPYTKVQLQNMDSIVVDLCFWDKMKETETKTVTSSSFRGVKIYRNVINDLKSLLCMFKSPKYPLVSLNTMDDTTLFFCPHADIFQSFLAEDFEQYKKIIVQRVGIKSW